MLNFSFQDETNLSTPRKKDVKNPRIQREDAHKRWKTGSKTKNGKGKVSPYSSALEKMTFPSDSSFSKDVRIRRNSEFKEVFEKGTRIRTPHFNVLYSPNNLGFPRIGVIVGKKTSLNAVGRNRIKRIVREVFRKNKASFDSFDVVIIAKKNCKGLTYKNAEEEILGFAEKKLS